MLSARRLLTEQAHGIRNDVMGWRQVGLGGWGCSLAADVTRQWERATAPGWAECAL